LSPAESRGVHTIVVGASAGGIWETVEDGIIRLRCRVGHEYSSDAFAADHGERVEAALWTALRALEEAAALHRRIAERQRERGNTRSAERFARRADHAVDQALVLRNVLSDYQSDADEEGAA
jgi:two-component system chemotaxis response regulator CheB